MVARKENSDTGREQHIERKHDDGGVAPSQAKPGQVSRQICRCPESSYKFCLQVPLRCGVSSRDVFLLSSKRGSPDLDCRFDRLTEAVVLDGRRSPLQGLQMGPSLGKAEQLVP